MRGFDALKSNVTDSTKNALAWLWISPASLDKLHYQVRLASVESPFLAPERSIDA
jgi:hypothetical protein